MLNFLADTLSDRFDVGLSGINDGFKWYSPAEGVVCFEPTSDCDTSVLISAGIHGNETAPVEIVDQLVSDIFAGKLPLNSRVMILLGNLDALKQGERYIDFDMNRLFDPEGVSNRDPESTRAQKIQALSRQFFNEYPEYRRIHLDLHTAIRPSHHERFGLLPYVKSGKYPKWWITFLQSINLNALVINHAPSSTYSYFTKDYCRAESVTLELGKALPLGENDLAKFQGIKTGLYSLVSSPLSCCSEVKVTGSLKVYKVSQILLKQSEAFKLSFADDVANFTSFQQGKLLATDEQLEYRVQENKEYVIFPNNNVKPGLRAGLMLVEDDIENHLN